LRTHILILISTIIYSALFLGGCSGQDNGSEPPAALVAPVNTAAIAGVRSLTVTWDNVAGATSYNIFYSTSPNVTPSDGSKIENVTSPYTLSGLTKDTTYYVVVTTVNLNKESNASSRISGTPHTISTVIGISQGYSAYGTAIASDKMGNLYSVGNVHGKFDGNMTTGFQDIFLVKHDFSGAKKWSKQIGATNNASSDASGVAVDSNGYVYITGTTSGSFDGNTKIGNKDFFLIKFDSAGNKLWSRQIGSVGVSIDRPSITVDKSGLVFVAGTTNGNLVGKMITGLQDLFISKFDMNGSMQWLQMRGITNQHTSATSVAVDSSGNVILAGDSCGGFDNITATGICDLLLLKYDTNGNKNWAQMAGAVGAYTNVQSVALDVAGNSYVTGFTGGNYDGITKPAWGDNMLLSKFDSNGAKQWSKLLGGGFYAYGNAIAVDSSGNAYVTGNTGNPIDGNTAIGQMDLFLVKYDTDGNKKWSKQLGVNYSSTSANGIITDGVGAENIYVVGSATGDVFTHVPNSSYNDAEFFLIGIDSKTGEY